MHNNSMTLHTEGLCMARHDGVSIVSVVYSVSAHSAVSSHCGLSSVPFSALLTSGISV